MARRGVPQEINWYLAEWMEMVFPNAHGRQAQMMRLTGWSKATMSQLYNNKQDYSPKIVNEASKALNVEPWELLMPPERAMRIRSVFAQLSEIATEVEPPEPARISAGRYLPRSEELRKTGTDDR